MSLHAFDFSSCNLGPPGKKSFVLLMLCFSLSLSFFLSLSLSLSVSFFLFRLMTSHGKESRVNLDDLD